MKIQQLFLPVLLTTLLLSLSNCAGNETESSDPENQETAVPKEDFETRVKHEIQVKLEIPATEKYEWKIYRSHINSDTIEDAIITVNRMSFAIDEAIRKNKTVKMAELGYMGNYNFLFYYDGALDKISVPIPIPSTPGKPLGIKFEHITSPRKNDVIVEYRIRNSGSRAYFTVLGEHDFVLMFRWNFFDRAGEDDPKALLHALETVPEREAKDIVIYESELDNNSKDIGDIYQFVPVITKKGKVVEHFVYDPRAGKYAALKRSAN